MILKERKERIKVETERIKAEAESVNVRQDKHIEREREIIKVITANTEVMAGLKVTLETTRATTNTYLTRIDTNNDEQNMKLSEMTAYIVRIISNQTSMADDINKILLLVNSMPNTTSISVPKEREE